MTEDPFHDALELVLKHEGGFVDHPEDPGGATNMGVTLATLEDWRGHAVAVEDLRALTEEEAAKIYFAGYWAPVKADELPAPVALMVFDAAVNHGPDRAARFLQLALGVPDDGVVGPVTLGAAREADPKALAQEIAALRMAFYGRLDTFRSFGMGWARRLMGTLRAALEIEA